MTCRTTTLTPSLKGTQGRQHVASIVVYVVVFRETVNTAPPRLRLTPPAAAMGIDNFDLVQLGSHFAGLNYR